jgi:hypothetical protein
MKPMPRGVAEIRVSLCPACAHLSGDPCAACAHGLWGPYVRCEPDLPPLATMAANLAQAAVAEASALIAGTPRVSDEEASRRLEICRSCTPHFRHSDARCSLCGCYSKYKTRLRSQHCPLGKW